MQMQLQKAVGVHQVRVAHLFSQIHRCVQFNLDSGMDDLLLLLEHSVREGGQRNNLLLFLPVQPVPEQS
jgi:hypothetical protein